MKNNTSKDIMCAIKYVCFKHQYFHGTKLNWFELGEKFVFLCQTCFIEFDILQLCEFRWRLPLCSTNIQKKKRGFPTKSRILLILTQQPVCITIVIFWFHGVTI